MATTVSQDQQEINRRRRVSAAISNMVTSLLTVGVNATDQFGNTPLILAAAGWDPQMVERLLTAGAHVNAANQEGNTPLIEAALFRNLQMVEMLLAAGAVMPEGMYGNPLLTLLRKSGISPGNALEFGQALALLQEYCTPGQKQALPGGVTPASLLTLVIFHRDFAEQVENMQTDTVQTDTVQTILQIARNIVPTLSEEYSSLRDRAKEIGRDVLRDVLRAQVISGFLMGPRETGGSSLPQPVFHIIVGFVNPRALSYVRQYIDNMLPQPTALPSAQLSAEAKEEGTQLLETKREYAAAENIPNSVLDGTKAGRTITNTELKGIGS